MTARPDGRRHPSTQTRVGGAVGEGQYLVPTDPAALVAGNPYLAELERQAIADLGGASRVSALRHEVLRGGLVLHYIGMCLLAEVEDKANRTRKTGGTPHPSRYKATGCIATFFTAAQRSFRDVGLGKTAHPAGLSGYLDGRRQEPQDDAAPAVEAAPGDTPETSAPAADADEGPS